MYRQPSLCAVFLSAIEIVLLSRTSPLVCCHPLSFYIRIHYIRAYFWVPTYCK